MGKREKKPVVLKCIVDICPAVNKQVDMRRCCGTKGGGMVCGYYGAVPWTEVGQVSCEHPQAKPSSRRERRPRMVAFKAAAGSAHLQAAGPLRIDVG